MAARIVETIPVKRKLVLGPFAPAINPTSILGPAEVNPKEFPSLESENRPTVSTAPAAYYLLRRPQTLRAWAAFETGPLRPIRINGRLAWPVAEIRRLLGVA